VGVPEALLGWVTSNHFKYLGSEQSYPSSYLLSNRTSSSGVKALWLGDLGVGSADELEVD
jgi:hypothetical protein